MPHREDDRTEPGPFQNNPFAICSAQIDRKKEPAKWERCVQDVKKRMGLSEDASETFTEDFPGGGYVAEHDNAGEFWTIRDVPFFSELPAGTRNNETAISREWMEDVLKRHQELETEQKHLPAVHANHHDSGRENFRIGFLRPTKIDRLFLEGKPRWTLFGDIVRVKDEHYNEIKDLRYPYRSAEIGRGWKPEISSVALLEDEAPHFKLPMLTIGEERRHYDRQFSASQLPAMGFSEVGDSAYICFSFRGTDMAEPKDVELFQDEDVNGEQKVLQESDESARKIAKMISTFVKKDLPAIVKQILDGMTPPNVRGDEGEIPVEPPMLKDKTETPDPVKKESKDNDLVPQLMAKVAALEEANRQRLAADKNESLVKEAAASLRSEGWHLPEKTEETMLKLARESEAALKTYVEEFKRTVPKDPPKTLEEVEVFAADPPEMAKYKTREPEIFESARSLSKQYDELKESGATLSTSREEFIDINLETVKV